jgi:hypothetical protein
MGYRIWKNISDTLPTFHTYFVETVSETMVYVAEIAIISPL